MEEEKKGKPWSCFQTLIGVSTIIGCIAAVIVIPQIQNLLNKVVPSTAETTSETPIVQLTAPPSEEAGLEPISSSNVLETGQAWKNDEIEVRLLNTNFSPGCSGIVSFNISFINLANQSVFFSMAGLDIIFYDESKNYYTDIWWQGGSPTTNCYFSPLSTLTLEGLSSGRREDLAFRVLGEPIASGKSLFVQIDTASDYIDVTWEIVFP